MKIRIAVVVDARGHWSSFGYHEYKKIGDKELMEYAWEGMNDVEEPCHEYFVEAELPDPPKPQIVQGKISEKSS